MFRPIYCPIQSAPKCADALLPKQNNRMLQQIFIILTANLDLTFLRCFSFWLCSLVMMQFSQLYLFNNTTFPVDSVSESGYS